VIGTDRNPVKTAHLNAAQAPVLEPGLGELIHDGVAAGRLSATDNLAHVIESTEMSLICVGTPSSRNGSIDLGAVATVCAEIGTTLRERPGSYTIVLRSTVLPGTLRSVVIPTLEDVSGRRLGQDLHVANNPEFLREGSAIQDFMSPPKTVVGSDDPKTRCKVLELYEDLPGPRFQVTPEVAELIKYTDNAWHALKVAFSNEVGNICQSAGVNAHDVMDVFCADLKLNISPAYLKPGFAFGGSCLPKDVRALSQFARTRDLDVPVLDGILRSNRHQIDRGVSRVLSYGLRRIAVLGFAFKSGTDDLRESPYINLIEQLIGKGCNVRLYDENVRLARLLGTNRDYLLQVIPHISELMVDSVDDALSFAELVLVCGREPAYRDALQGMEDRPKILDFVNVADWLLDGADYESINW
jgi:GDP-mannose 6-dehydrogenase